MSLNHGGDLSASSKASKDENNNKLKGLRARLRQRRGRNNSEGAEIKSRPNSLDLDNAHSLSGMRGNRDMYSTATMPVGMGANGHYYQGSHSDLDNGPSGLVLGEFKDGFDDVAEDEEYDDGLRPSGAILRAQSQEFDGSQHSPNTSAAAAAAAAAAATTANRNRRPSIQSVPAYDRRTSQASKAMADGVVPTAGLSDAATADNLTEAEEGHNHNMAVNSEQDEESAMDSGGNYNGYSYDEETGAEAGSGGGDLNGDDDFDAEEELNAVYLKRNADFHSLFRSIPINELLIDDYGCALQRDILVQGRLYLTENFVCFYSNIFGWVTNLVIAFDEIVSMEKKMTALIIPNAIQISTLHAKHFFGSFIYRDSAYNQLYDLWAKSRNEKNAGLPEIGHAEDGDGAGDVSRNREDIINAYQSLSEDEDDDMDDEAMSEGSDMSRYTDEPTDLEPQDDVVSNANTPISTSAITPTSDLASANGGDGNKEQGESTTVNNNDTNAVASELLHTASQMSDLGTKVPGTENNVSPTGTLGNSTAGKASAASIINTSAAALASTNSLNSPLTTEKTRQRLLSKVPKTPDGADSMSLASSTRSGIPPRDGSHVQPFSLHKPTTCPCGSNGKTAHYSQESLDAVFPLSLPLLYRLVFSASVPSEIAQQYIPAGLVSKEELDQGCTKRIIEWGNTDVKTEGWVPDPSDSDLEMCIYSYEKPLGFSIGPKSTMVEDSFRITTRDFDKAVIVEQVVKTPNVPSGTSFFVKIRHCLTWTSGPGSQPPGGWSRYQMTFEVEWVKSSWIKGAIEKGTVDSNKQVGEQLEKYIREWAAAHPALEIKPTQPSSGSSLRDGKHHRISKRSGGGSSRRKKSSKRDSSPRGLRMEEVLGKGDGRRRRSEAGRGREEHSISGDSAQVPTTAETDRRPGKDASAHGRDSKTGDARLARVWKQRASDSWMGWVGYYTMYPTIHTTRKVGRKMGATISGPISGPMLVGLLAILLVISNVWRLSSVALSAVSKATAGSLFGPNRVHVDGMSQMRDSVDALAEQMSIINQRLQQLIERQQNSTPNGGFI